MIHFIAGRKARRRQQSVCAAIEALPNRILLSVSLNGQTLNIVGTDSADHITVAADPKLINIADVDLNGSLSYFALGAFKQISIQGLGGNDRIIVDSSLDAVGQVDFVDGQMSGTPGVGIGARVDGGVGDDTIITGAGNDTLTGADGNDRINANGGSDWLQGDAGNDTLNGGDQNDMLVGGAGNDSLSGGNGKDTLSDSAGQDLIHGNAGNDIIKDSASGNLYGDHGDDTITASGDAYVYGGDNEDSLTGSTVWGGGGSDTIIGTDKSDSIHGDDGNDVIHGGDGNDLIYGDDGSDQIYGDDGNDAMYGGSMSDTIHGGPGNDNLYGDDGAKDTNHTDDGNDAGYGDTGSDWFEPTHVWAVTDYNPKQDSKQQIHLSQDPSYGSGAYTGSSGSVIQLGSGSASVTTTTTPSAPGTPDVPELKSLNEGGFLATGMLDTTTNLIVPAELDKAQKSSLKPVIMQLPPTWKVGKTLTASGDIVWYRLSGETVQADSLVNEDVETTPSVPTAPTVPSAPTNPITPTVPNAPSAPNAPSTPVVIVTAPPPAAPSVHTAHAMDYSTPASAMATDADTTPASPAGATIGVDSYYRFLAVKCGTNLVSSPDNPTSLSWDWQNRSTISLPMRGTIWLAGDSTMHSLSINPFNLLPANMPDTGQGIVCADGLIWLLPNESPTFIAD